MGSMKAGPDLERLTSVDEAVPVATANSFQHNPALSLDRASLSLDSNPKPFSKHARRNSTVQEQRAQRVKAQETERMLSLPRVRLTLQLLPTAQFAYGTSAGRYLV